MELVPLRSLLLSVAFVLPLGTAALAQDTDGDGIEDAADNCPNHANPSQADCDADGAGDVCEIADGSAVDLNSNGRPDSCDLAWTPGGATAGAVEWTEGGHARHWYLISQDRFTFEEARAYAASLGGHLAAITSEDEYNFVRGIIQSNPTRRYWVGTVRNEQTGWDWGFITGEPRYWGLPFSDGGWESFATVSFNGAFAGSNPLETRHYIVEFDFADANADGILDFGQQVDCNQNGLRDRLEMTLYPSRDCDDTDVVDVCELGVTDHVVTQQTTIEPAGGVKTIELVANPLIVSNARLDVRAWGDLDEPEKGEWIDVTIEGLRTVRLAGSQCGDVYGTIFAPVALLEPRLADDFITITITTGPAVDLSVCGDSGVDISVRYATALAGLDCNGNQVPDSCEIAAGAPDCDGNGLLDGCEINELGADCDANGRLDRCDIALGEMPDANGDDIIDSCLVDCDGDGANDAQEMRSGTDPDCNGNDVPDSCDIANGTVDANANGVPDSCDLVWTPPASMTGIVRWEQSPGDAHWYWLPTDQSRNFNDARNYARSLGGHLVAITSAAEQDFVRSLMQSKGVSEIWIGAERPCGQSGYGAFAWLTGEAMGFNRWPTSGGGSDCNYGAGWMDSSGNWYEQYRWSGYRFVIEFDFRDCDGDGAPDEAERADSSLDCDLDGRLDACAIASGEAADSDGNGIPDGCTADCDGDGLTDAFEIGIQGARDDDRDMTPDACEIAQDPSLDRNGNGRLDSIELTWTPPESMTGIVRWEQSPGDAHWYWLAPNDHRNFNEARNYARSLGGHLVAITSAAEQDFVRNLMQSKGVSEIWIGAERPCGQSGYGPFAWLTGEPMAFNRWPTSGGGSSCDYGAGRMDSSGNWFDQLRWNGYRFVIEFDFRDCDGDGYLDEAERVQLAGDCDADNILDECAIANGSVVDTNGDGLPDRCESDCDADGLSDYVEITYRGEPDLDLDGLPDACEIAQDPSLDRNGNGRFDSIDFVWTPPASMTGIVRWEQSPGDRHWYWLAPNDHRNFNEARNYARSLGGHLVAITSAAEQDFVRSLMQSKGVSEIWIGAERPCGQSGYGPFAWLTGEPMGFNRWPTSGGGSDCNYGAGWMDSSGNWYEQYRWNGYRFVVEFDFRDCDGDGYLDEAERSQLGADCDADNILDECAIANGSVVDTDGDGTPDLCEADCDSDGLPDYIEITYRGEPDLDLDGLPDACEIAQDPALDGNGNGRIDSGDIAWVPPASLTGIFRWQRVPGDNRWYYRVTSSRTYDQAKADAALLGGQLATITTYTERQFFETRVPFNSTHWIGFERPCYDGSAANFGWYTGEPNRTSIPVNAISANVCVNVPATIRRDSSGNPAYYENQPRTNSRQYYIEFDFSDCNGNGTLDRVELQDISRDCDGDGLLDTCQIAAGLLLDTNANGVPDGCETDCDSDGTPDAVEIANGQATDCNGNTIPDACDLAAGVVDANGNGRPDSCDLSWTPNGVVVNATRWNRSGSDGHWYWVSSFSRSYDDAKAYAASLGGRLATITTREEQAFVRSMLGATNTSQFWVGLERPCGESGFDAFEWISGESNADPLRWIEDSDYGCSGRGSFVPAVGFQMAHQTTSRNFIVEFDFTDCNGNGVFDWIESQDPDIDCNLDGVPDTCAGSAFVDCNANGLNDRCEVLSGSAADSNGNRIPDTCDVTFTPNGATLSAVRWERRPGDRHWYLLVSSPATYDTARETAASLGGHLVSITSAEEWQFIRTMLGTTNQNQFWMGMERGCYEYSTDEFAWTTGERRTFSAPWVQNPSSSCLFICATLVPGSGWLSDNRFNQRAYIVEFDFTDCDGNGAIDWVETIDPALDCNANGLLDACDIASGAADCDGNGVIDTCDIASGAADCNSNGVIDSCDLASGAGDCDANGVIDTCDIASGAADCDANGVIDSCDIASGAADIDANSIPDSCQTDCNANQLPDSYELANGAPDCNANGVIDSCDLASGAADCDGNGVIDTCDIASGAADCNANGVIDTCDIATGAGDCDGNGVIDTCDIASGAADCNANGVPDTCDLTSGAADVDANGIPDSCQPDCNANQLPDSYELANGAADCNANGVIDSCDLATGAGDCNGNGVIDTCDIASGAADCNANGVIDSCDLATGAGDCDGNGVIDTCDIASGAADCNANGVIDSCDLASGAGDCDGNGVIDTCDIASGAADCNANGVIDSCDLAGGAGDCDGNGVIDTCDIASGAADCNANGVIDSCDLASGAGDCDGNGVIDTCDIASGAPDCNANNLPDTCDLASGAADVDANGIPDSCQADCNGNQLPDSYELANGAPDCNANGVIDSCDIASGAVDVDQNGVPDVCDPDCDANTLPDAYEIANGAADCNGNGVPDTCDLAAGIDRDANSNGRLDGCDIAWTPGGATAGAVEWTLGEYGGNWYMISSERLNRWQAEEAARLLGGHLATVTSQAEWEFVQTVLAQRPGFSHWLGMRDYYGDRSTITGEPWTWNPPWITNPTYPGFVAASSTGWRHSYDNELRYFLIEFDFADANENGLLDLYEAFFDCNGNNLRDMAEARIYPELDCDDSYSLDACDVSTPPVAATRDGSLATAGQTVVLDIPVRSDVGTQLSITLEVSADVNEPSKEEWIAMHVEGIETFLIYDEQQDCYARRTFTIPLAAVLPAFADGNLRVELTTGASVDFYCGGFTLDLAYGLAPRAPDCNANGLPDSCDLESGTAADCNDNEIPDSCDIAAGAADANGNGVPDVCEAVPGDINGDGIVGAADLSMLLSNWGAGAGSAADIDGNGTVGPADLSILLGLWGSGG